MNISERQVGQVLILGVEGKLTRGNAADTLNAAVDQALENGERAILLDLEKLSYLEEACLDGVMAMHSRAAMMGAKLKVMRARMTVKAMFGRTMLDHVISMYNNERDALASF